MASRTEAEVRRLLGELVGRKLVAARLLTVERLRSILGAEERESPVARLITDGLLALVIDVSQSPDLRARALDAIAENVDVAVLRIWAHDWPRAWTDRFLAIAGDRSAAEPGRLLAVRALEARVLEEPAIDAVVTDLLAGELAFGGNSTGLRRACLEALAETHRSNPDWLVELRQSKRIERGRLVAWAAWRALSTDERTLVAVLADGEELERSLAHVEQGAEIDALEAADLHTRHDPSSARALLSLVRRFIPVARTVERGASSAVVGHVAEQRHAALVRAAVAYDRARGELDLSWVEPALVDAVTASAQLALELESEPRFEADLALWTDLFRDRGSGLVMRLLEIVRSSTSLDSAMPAAAVALCSVGDASREQQEAKARVLDAVRRAHGSSVRAAVRIDVLVGMVAPEHVLELQEARILPSVDVPTDEECSRLHHDDASTLARRVRLSRVADVLSRGTDTDRIGTALLVLPSIVRWLPRELVRFEPLVRKHLGNARPLRDPRTFGRRPIAVAEPGTIGHRAFDVYIRSLVELTLVPAERRPAVVIEHLAASFEATAREALRHGHGGKSLANAAKEVLSPERMIAARTFWIGALLDRREDTARRIDAHAALEALGAPEIADAVEEVLARDDEPELGAFLVASFENAHPERFAALARTGRLRIALPPVERLFGARRDASRPDASRPEEPSRRQRLELIEDRCRALALAISAEQIVGAIERGEPIAETLAAMHLVQYVFVEREVDPMLVERARTALATRTGDRRSYEAMVDGQREILSVGPVAFGAYMRVLGARPAASAEIAIAALMTSLEQLDAALEDEGVPDLAPVRDIVRRFADAASETIERAAVTAVEARLATLFQSPTRNVEALELVLGVYAETMTLLGGASGAASMNERLERIFGGAEPGAAGARYCAFRLLAASAGVDRRAVLDRGARLFMDETTDGALRTLLGSVITIWKPDAFEAVVDMNTQPWVVRRPEHASLPASSLPANMPASWLVAVLRMAEHDEPHQRAVSEIVARLVPARSWEWRKVPARWLELVGGHADAIRRGLRAVLQRPEPKHVSGRHVDAARLLALFGNEEDEPLLAAAAGRQWIDREPPLEPVFWRPAGKAPALGVYSFLEVHLEVAFGSERRYRILSEAYALAAERADAQGEGGTASRYAYEAFLLAPDSPRAKSVLERFNR